jgi:hypothetical protein
VPDDGRRAGYHLARGETYRLLGEAASAKVEYQTALTFEPDLVAAHIGLSTLRMPGPDYLSWLERLHAVLMPETYLEIGVERGYSLAFARPPTRAIGVDPAPMINVPFKTETHIFCETSDEFFARERLASLLQGQPLSLVFIDGLHVFQQSLRDFMHVEAFCGPKSVILFHDTIPLDEVTQRPDQQRRFYTGDVWKTVLCLKHFRPDLDIFTIATPWTGLTVVSGLAPSSRLLAENYDAAVARFLDAPFAAWGPVLDEALNVVPNDWPVVEERLRKAAILDK